MIVNANGPSLVVPRSLNRAADTLALSNDANTAHFQAELASENVSQTSVETRFQSIIGQLLVSGEIGSRILDKDYAQEHGQLTKNQILQQAGVAMLSQANAMPQVVLSLLGR